MPPPAYGSAIGRLKGPPPVQAGPAALSDCASRGLWRATEEQELYPSPSAVRRISRALHMYHFLGRMLGKALYEARPAPWQNSLLPAGLWMQHACPLLLLLQQLHAACQADTKPGSAASASRHALMHLVLQGILLELPLAGFFVKKLLGRACDVNDLPSLDPQLYASLMALREYTSDVADLALFFTIADQDDPSREVAALPCVQQASLVLTRHAALPMQRAARHGHVCSGLQLGSGQLRSTGLQCSRCNLCGTGTEGAACRWTLCQVAPASLSQQPTGSLTSIAWRTTV